MVKAEQIVKYFGRFCALDHVDLHVPKGAVYGLVGPNGAGKSTMIRHIMGIYRPFLGRVLIDGEPVYEHEAVKRNIAYIPDELFYFAQANTMEMKRFYAGLYPQFDEKMFEQLREFFPSIDTRRRIRKLSKGMQKQVFFWLSLCCNPRLMVLDEPIDGLDPVMRRQLWNLILEQVRVREMTVLISSHNLRELEDVCDYVGMMHQGRLLLEHSLCELQQNISKVQVAFAEGTFLPPKELKVLHLSNLGRVYTLILKGDPKQAVEKLQKLNPLLVDVLPLSLEEIFIYELGGADYAVKDILF